MATPVDEVDVPYVSLDPSRREAASAKLDPSTWLYKSEIGYLVSGHADVQTVLADRRWRSVLPTVVEPDPELKQWLSTRQANLLLMDGDDHQRLRRVVGPWLTPQRVAAFRPMMRDTIEELLAPVVDRACCEFISEVSDPYATHVVFDVVGASPAWRDRFRVLSNERIDRAINMASPARDVIEITEAFDELVNELIEDPLPARRDSLIDVIRRAESAGHVSRPEAVMLIQNIIGGATDSTLAQLGSAVCLFAMFNDEYQALRREPGLAGQAVEEVMRYRGAARGAARIASEAIVHKQVLFPRGTTVTLNFVGANRDATVFQNARRFDISSSRDASQVSFGHGAHFCIGAALARAELTEALGALANTVGRISVVGEIVWRPSLVDFWGPASLPVQLHSAAHHVLQDPPLAAPQEAMAGGLVHAKKGAFHLNGRFEFGHQCHVPRVI